MGITNQPEKMPFEEWYCFIKKCTKWSTIEKKYRTRNELLGLNCKNIPKFLEPQNMSYIYSAKALSETFKGQVNVDINTEAKNISGALLINGKSFMYDTDFENMKKHMNSSTRSGSMPEDLFPKLAVARIVKILYQRFINDLMEKVTRADFQIETFIDGYKIKFKGQEFIHEIDEEKYYGQDAARNESYHDATRRIKRFIEQPTLAELSLFQHLN